jgi:hypothetical protein
MSPPPQFKNVLRSTGFMIGEQSAPGLILSPPASNRPETFQPDAVWRDRSSIEIFFKFAPSQPQPKEVASWHRDVWNLGVAPLLWVVSPQKIELFNTFQRPESLDSADTHLLKAFQALDDELARLDEYAGRLSMVSGRFWSNERRVKREGRVDQQLLRDLHSLEERLCAEGLPRTTSQGLIGRSIFIRYLTDRGIIDSDILEQFGSTKLENILSGQQTAYQLFEWIRNTFNGDLFPVEPSERRTVKSKHLRLVADTLAGVSPTTGQGSLWPYEFDVIPIELISSIYEQFSHSEDSDAAQSDGMHYTPVSLVNLVLDEVLRDIKADARVLDMTCGSGVFLVEALRRLVKRHANGRPVTRQLIRKTIRDQIFGVDKNEAAIRVASFSLYLTALELDPDPRPPKALRFEPLIGRNLFVADAFKLKDHPDTSRLCHMRFDAIVGNPPWTYSGSESKPTWPSQAPALPPRSQDFAFVWRSIELAHETTRFGIVMRATPYFSTADASRRARNQLFNKLAPIALVNLSALRDDLFPTADYPAVVLFARLHNRQNKATIPVISVPWTSTFSRSGAFEISPSDVHFAPIQEIQDSPYALKAFALGTPRDRLLLRRVSGETPSLSEVLEKLKLTIVTGVQLLAGDQNDASHLIGLPLLDSGELELRIESQSLPHFTRRKIHRPRDRAAFRGPLVLLGEGLRDGRVSIGVSEQDVVYTRSFYGISFAGKTHSKGLALCLAGVLQSAVASWHLLLTASEFGIHKRKLLLQDILALPVPQPDRLTSGEAHAVAAAVRELDATSHKSLESGLNKIDDAVFDLFALSDHERLVVREGLARAKREYVAPRLLSDVPIRPSQLNVYAHPFLDIVNAWNGALGRQRYDAEIFNVRTEAALRIVRFVTGTAGEVRMVELNEGLNDVLDRIGNRMRLPIAERLAAVRELRVHADGELFVIKPAACRYWSPSAGLNDADAALGDGLQVGSE